MSERNKDEIIGSWRKFLNKELHKLKTSPNINRITKSRRLRWAWHAASIAEKRNS
jgi:hypothetical protein